MKNDWPEPQARPTASKKRTAGPVATRFDLLSEFELQKRSKDELIAEVRRCHLWMKNCAIECGLCPNEAGIVGWDADVSIILHRKLQFDAVGPLHHVMMALDGVDREVKTAIKQQYAKLRKTRNSKSDSSSKLSVKE